jgi:uncharacterized cupredoxin-like copper-binding protein
MNKRLLTPALMLVTALAATAQSANTTLQAGNTEATTASTTSVKPAATPLKRGLMALHQSAGNLV